MAKYRKKPIIIDAVQFVGGEKSGDDMLNFCEEAMYDVGKNYMSIFTLEGEMKASPGDWIIKGVEDEFYPCKPDIFEATYEPIE